MKIAKKSDWKLHDMSRPVRINIDIKLTDKDYHNLISGLKPDDMGEKWFVYAENDWVFFHRSWTGYEIFRCKIENISPELYVINEFLCESNKEIFSFEDPEFAINEFSSFVNWLSHRFLSIPLLDGIMGLIVGDALGVPYEFKKRDQMKKAKAKDMIGYGTHKQPPGTWSDDTSLTMCTVEALSEGYDLDKIGKNFVDWLYHHKWTPYGEVFDVGISTAEAINRIKNGVRPELAGNKEGTSNGNGSLMRILPLLAITFDIKDDFERFEIISKVSSITHAHIRSQLACFYYLEVANELYKYSWSDKRENGYSTANYKTKSIIEKIGCYNELKHFERLFSGKIHELKESDIKSSGYVIDTLEASIWCLLKTKSYEEAVLKAVNLGEDTDTVAAVTGGLAGIYYSRYSIPEKWFAKLPKFDDIIRAIIKLCDRYELARN